ncbi:uncharacterized protein PGTG_19299 [Puccinia graminis f. sp. tritici CRL 75-36-700-3]|uniref:Uncharacterized protein n=1 Tax=Puccinia graminis f. sp. tritici (strain CRL 75-36-700-3 / race SCCL) TaxID=418459 RepID=E3L9W9_PUCGT|nr:uncharacterized protein PGTG_19299 [Puccinia graminis f. sp. tritici CRL 75-36-700-3]EFP93344.1 hypothetical protein PGTG_19299 [Puccinia graminis f. sp. tritici CRL 75-36-700-3]
MYPIQETIPSNFQARPGAQRRSLEALSEGTEGIYKKASRRPRPQPINSFLTSTTGHPSQSRNNPTIQKYPLKHRPITSRRRRKSNMASNSSPIRHTLVPGKTVTVRQVTDTYSPAKPNQPQRLTREFETTYYLDLIPDLYAPTSATTTYTQSHYYVDTTNTLVVYKKDIRFPQRQF